MIIHRRQTLKVGLLALAVMIVAKVAMTIAAPASSQRKPQTVEKRLREHGAKVDERLRPLFAARKISYPPAKLTLVGLKDEKKLEVYAADQSSVWRMIKSYDVLAASGTVGPKLREGDRQVPEGIYKISLLNPNSRYHLSLRVNYPNEFDRRMASADSRTRLGGDIMIHGNAVSIGCVAIGDEGAEDLFVLAARTGLPNISVILSPLDFRKRRLPIAPGSPKWIEELYRSIRHELDHYPADVRLD